MAGKVLKQDKDKPTPNAGKIRLGSVSNTWFYAVY